MVMARVQNLVNAFLFLVETIVQSNLSHSSVSQTHQVLLVETRNKKI